jgi:hypothetical protein
VKLPDRLRHAPGTPDPDTAAPARAGRKPIYPRLLRLHHVRPNAWQRAVLGEGAVGAGALLALADLASAWAVVVLPVTVAGIVKAHDLLQGLLDPADDDGTGSPDGAGAGRWSG